MEAQPGRRFGHVECRDRGIELLHLRATQPHRGLGDVHRRVARADDRQPLANRRRSPAGGVVDLRQLRHREKLGRAGHTLEILTGKVERQGNRRARADEHGVEPVGPELIDREVGPIRVFSRNSTSSARKRSISAVRTF